MTCGYSTLRQDLWKELLIISPLTLRKKKRQKGETNIQAVGETNVQ